jgi:hypothetical protein
MTNGAQGPLVCGFGDASVGIGGLAWDLAEPAAVLLSQGEARSGTFALELGGDDATLQITAGDTTVEATLSARTAEIALDGGPTTSVCVAEVRSEGGAPTVECTGQICRWAASPLEGSGTFRQIAVEAGDEALLVITARGEPGAAGHGEEQAQGWLIQGEDVTAYEESLISTQYDGEGDPTRIGLELWPADADQTSRAAATRASGNLLGGARSGGAWAGFFRCHTGEFEGIGSYLLWRP